jgi:myo-inositol-1-phosphate synthase
LATKEPVAIAPADGKLGVLLPGLGAVSTTFIAGVEAVKRGLAAPIGSLTQLSTVRLGKRNEGRTPLIKDFVPLAGLDDLEFAAWDIYEDNAYEAARKAAVLDAAMIERVREPLEKIHPMEAVFVWTGSTEVYNRPAAVHQSLKAFEAGLRANDPDIAPSQIYAYAALKMGIPYANGAPNLTVDTPALLELARETKLPVCGKDFKTGQTLMKTMIAPGLKARMLGMSGWFSTNILGNRDGEVLEDPGSFKSKEETKLSVLDQILQPELYPQLYGNLFHSVRINYYPPRGDAKEGWDNIDIFGWLGYPMQIKINFLCRDSILAAPLVLDLVLFLDLAHRAGMRGIQEWLSFYFKAPMHAPDIYPEHDIFIQLMKLKNTLRWMRGEDLITHLGLEYYD